MSDLFANLKQQILSEARKVYDQDAQADLELMQAGQISHSEWNRRQREHCDRLLEARLAADQVAA